MGIRVVSTFNNKMRLLIAHDVMNRIDETLDDLRWAGLPRGATARVLSTNQIMAPAPEAMAGIDHTLTLLESEVEETIKLYCRRLQEIFPEWEIRGLTAIGPLTLEALDRAEEWNPDLIVVGADDHPLLERLFGGSVSSVLVRQALCSVRVARGRAGRGDPHTRLLIGVDGSEYAEALHRQSMEIADQTMLSVAQAA